MDESIRSAKTTYSISDKQDIRIGLMNEIISCMKLIKMHCWEYSFADKIAEARKSEMNIIRLH